MPAMALAGAVSAMAAQNIGAGQLQRVRRITLVGIGYNFLLTGGLIVLLTFIDRWALSIFLENSGDAMDIATMLMATICYLWGSWRKSPAIVDAAIARDVHHENTEPSRLIEAPASADPTQCLMCRCVNKDRH